MTPLHVVGLRLPNPYSIPQPQALKVRGKYKETTLSILRGGADPNRPDCAGNTPLHCAADTGQADVVAALREWGADPTVQNAYGETPVHRAMAHGHLEELDHG
ncbi:ankyrin repeat-containing domain protein [Baffinella frigidus]|nr:ankyrin repeat-containing domain protein [Cryptophyta sp. CCMP2293]